MLLTPTRNRTGAHMKINTNYTLYAPAKAEEIAALLTADGDGWTYKAKHDPLGTGWSFIEVFDEDQFIIGRVTF